MLDIIQANCRVRFTAQDFQYICSVLDPQNLASRSLLKLFEDPDSWDVVLDSEELYLAMLEKTECMRVSSCLYFYVMVRRMLRRGGVEDRMVADYVASLLERFSDNRRARHPLGVKGRSFDYLTEMFDALENASPQDQFLIRAHMGNHSLFWTGLFPERIAAKTQRTGAPKIEYYESIGSVCYRVASHNHLAEEFHLNRVLESLSECFHTVRLGLNRLADTVFFLDVRPMLQV